MSSLLLIGGGGHCRACIDVIELQGDYRIAGIVERPGEEHRVAGYPVLGSDDDLPRLLRDTRWALITLGMSHGAERRRELYHQVRASNGRLATIVSPLAHLSRHARLGEGSIIMHQALVNAGARIGANTIINSQALVEHDSTVGDHCHIATGARINGGCRIGDGSLIGSGATILPGRCIAPGSRIGAGAVVTRDITSAGVWAGCPARPLEGQR